MARCMTAAGARRGDMLHVAFGYGLCTGGLGFRDGAERIGMTVVPVSSGTTARHLLLLQDFRPAGLCGTPSFVLHIAESLVAEGGDPRALGLRYGMFGAEPWSEGGRVALEQALGCPAFDIYGLSEIIGPGVAGECAGRGGAHTQGDAFPPRLPAAPAGAGGRCGGFDAEHPEIVALRARAAERLQRAIGLSVRLTIVAPRTLPRSEGKAVRVVERRE